MPSRSPARARQDDEETVHVPTTEPPHGATSLQDGPAPPVPPAPPPPVPLLPELEQAEAQSTTVARRPTPRKPKSACRMGLFVLTGRIFSKKETKGLSACIPPARSHMWRLCIFRSNGAPVPINPWAFVYGNEEADGSIPFSSPNLMGGVYRGAFFGRSVTLELRLPH